MFMEEDVAIVPIRTGQRTWKKMETKTHVDVRPPALQGLSIPRNLPRRRRRSPRRKRKAREPQRHRPSKHDPHKPSVAASSQGEDSRAEEKYNQLVARLQSAKDEEEMKQIVARVRSHPGRSIKPYAISIKPGASFAVHRRRGRTCARTGTNI